LLRRQLLLCCKASRVSILSSTSVVSHFNSLFVIVVRQTRVGEWIVFPYLSIRANDISEMHVELTNRAKGTEPDDNSPANLAISRPVYSRHQDLVEDIAGRGTRAEMQKLMRDATEAANEIRREANGRAVGMESFARAIPT
ncbi:MAG: hypothetical protein ACPGVG_18590, partial [Mycobacterium sp.]